MKDFKKRSLVLVLASVITVTGSFASENYKNCLMDMTFKASGANKISMVLSTKRLYEGTINPVKRDANTYVIMLPEVDSNAPSPDLSEADGNIESVTVKKMPYANGSKGYTRITIKTADNVSLNATSTIYIPEKKENRTEARQDERSNEAEDYEDFESRQREMNRQNAQRDSNISYQQKNKYRTEAKPQERSSYRDEKTDSHNQNVNLEIPSQTDINQQPLPVEDIQTQTSDENNNNQKYILGLWIVLIIMTSTYFYIKAQDKLRNVLGEKLEIDVEKEDKKNNSKSQKDNKKISRTINKLDSAYSKTAYIPLKPPVQAQEEESQEELNIVDLDALFKEQTKAPETVSEEEENDALDDFLSGFSFDDEFQGENEEKSDEEIFTYDKDVYEQVLQDNELKFTEEDILCFNELLQSEISSEVMNNLSKYAVSNPIASQKPQKDSTLVNIVTDFAIKQNISFSAEDIIALKKIMSVELDSDFVTNLKTNSQKTQEMEQALLQPKPRKIKPVELITLNVKDMLPNLAEELKQQGNKPIEFDAKPETVYFSEGYEVSTLKLDIDLPDLAKEVNNSSAYQSKPSEKVQVVDSSYFDSVEKITISGLPDLKDVMENPDKYEDSEPEVFVADENFLLNSIANVQFKPFDDGTRNFEIINNEEDFDEPVETSYDDFEAIYNQEFYDLDAINQETTQNKEKAETKILDNTEPLAEKNPIKKLEPEQKKEVHSEDVQKKTAASARQQAGRQRETKQTIEIQRLLNNDTKPETKITSQPVKKPVQEKKTSKVVINNNTFNVLNLVEISNGIGCYLAKSEKGYVVLAYKGDETTVLKEYDTVKSEKIQARIHETLADGTLRYLIRVGANKLVADLKDGKLNYVMDLC